MRCRLGRQILAVTAVTDLICQTHSAALDVLSPAPDMGARKLFHPCVMGCDYQHVWIEGRILIERCRKSVNQGGGCRPERVETATVRGGPIAYIVGCVGGGAKDITQR